MVDGAGGTTSVEDGGSLTADVRSGSRTDVVEGAGGGFSLVVLVGSRVVAGLEGGFRLSDEGSSLVLTDSRRVVLDTCGRAGLVDMGLGGLVVVVAPSETSSSKSFSVSSLSSLTTFLCSKR